MSWLRSSTCRSLSAFYVAELTVRVSDHMSAYRTEDISIDYGGLDGRMEDALDLFKTHECGEEEEE